MYNIILSITHNDGSVLYISLTKNQYKIECFLIITIIQYHSKTFKNIQKHSKTFKNIRNSNLNFKFYYYKLNRIITIRKI